jgi:hypothetical protein
MPEQEIQLMTQPAHRQQENASVGIQRKSNASPWIFSIDELPESKSCLLEIDSPQVYLTCSC